jgi:hypothetical protein
MESKYNRIVVAGAGAGFWTVVDLCRMFSKDLTIKSLTIEVYDDDTFEKGTGYRRLPKSHDPSQYKVDALKTFVQYIMGDPPPTIHRSKLTPKELLTGDWTKTLVLDCTDMSVNDRLEFWDALKASGATGLRGSMDGTGVAVVSPGPPIVFGEDNLQGYDIPTNQGQVSRAAGQLAEAVLYTIRTGKILEFQTFVPTPETSSLEITQGEQDVIRNSHYEEVSGNHINSGDNRDQSGDPGVVSGSSEGPGRMVNSASGD